MYQELYEVLEPLGRGSYGTVYKVRSRADGKILVGKEIDFLHLSDREKSQLSDEIMILKVDSNNFCFQLSSVIEIFICFEYRS